jgi:hypothetical protein
MAAEDITAQVTAWVLDETGKQCFGEHYGVAVTWAVAPLQTPQGAVMIPAWQLVITCRNPLAGQGDLFHLAQLGIPRPDQAGVRKEVADGIRQLRELVESKLAGTNGRPRLVVPG